MPPSKKLALCPCAIVPNAEGWRPRKGWRLADAVMELMSVVRSVASPALDGVARVCLFAMYSAAIHGRRNVLNAVYWILKPMLVDDPTSDFGSMSPQWTQARSWASGNKVMHTVLAWAWCVRGGQSFDGKGHNTYALRIY